MPAKSKITICYILQKSCSYVNTETAMSQIRTIEAKLPILTRTCRYGVVLAPMG